MAPEIPHMRDDIEIAQAVMQSPGTELLFVEDLDAEGLARDFQLKHIETSTGSRLVLVPQPSDDPNDPLRWPLSKKYVKLAIGITYSTLGTITGPLMAAGVFDLIAVYQCSIQKIVTALGTNLLMAGVANLFWIPFALKFGRRPVYLLSCTLMGLALVWLAIATKTTYISFLLGRLFLGMWQAPQEALVGMTVTDAFFLHNRGALISLFGMLSIAGTSIGPLLSGFIIQDLGPAWPHWIIAIAVFTTTVAMFFFMPETKYTGVRPDVVAILSKTVSPRQEKGEAYHNEISEVEETPKLRTFVQELAFWGRNDHSVSLLKSFVRPVVLLAYPTVLWASLINGFALTWNGILASLVAQLFAPPPYLFNPRQQGLVFLGALIGSLPGAYISGPLADRMATWLTKRNKGIREPEMRLPIAIPAAIFTFLGALVMGLTFKYETHWIGPVVGIALISFGAQTGFNLGMTYLLDCHREYAGEVMVTITAVRSTIAWIWTWFISDWVASAGLLTVFMTIAAMNTAVYLTTLIFWYKGVEIRRWIHTTKFVV